MTASTNITASMLYDLVQCPHRPIMDLFADGKQRDDISLFVQLLWEKGALFEKEVIDGLSIKFLDLSIYSLDEKERLTEEAMRRGEELIYGGRISHGDLLGDPDLLRKTSGGYIAGDIKSGAGEEGREDLKKPKKHYGVQVALYTDILEQKGLSAGRRAFIWDIHGEEVEYDLEEPIGVRTPTTLWQQYENALALARGIADSSETTLPANYSGCKLCYWRSACLKDLETNDDLTLIPELGRAKRDVMMDQVPTIGDLAASDVERFFEGKKTVFPGIGPDTLRKFHMRANLLTEKTPSPFLRAPVSLPMSRKELFFDIEVDPFNDFCYLHGFVVREDGDTKNQAYLAFFADGTESEDEKRAFADALEFIRGHQPCAIYYYSKYERTIWRKLQGKYPDVCSTDDIEELFDPSVAIDLYSDVVKTATEWPTRDHSIKTLAKYLGFNWRDVDPSGAASIEWFHRYVETGDTTIRTRILEYNEDDCIATCVLLDGIRNLTLDEPSEV
jgi:uncharacterized protein